jgi:hypothetical protein
MAVAAITPAAKFERTPPHDLAAEQRSRRNADVQGCHLRRSGDQALDHYRPAHQLVHEAILSCTAGASPRTR